MSNPLRAAGGDGWSAASACIPPLRIPHKHCWTGWRWGRQCFRRTPGPAAGSLDSSFRTLVCRVPRIRRHLTEMQKRSGSASNLTGGVSDVFILHLVGNPHSSSTALTLPPFSFKPTNRMVNAMNSRPRNGSERPPMSSQRRWKLLLSYAPDWIITILVTGLFYLLDGIHGFWRNFSLTDTSIQYNYALQERVPNWALYLIALVAPLVIMPIINLISIRSWWDWHNSWLGLILSLGLTGTITNIVKITAGRPRPDLVSRCQPVFDSGNAPIFGLTNASICTQSDMKILKDGFRSFFSGHSSLSFAGLGFLFWYLSGKMHLFDMRGHAGKAWIAFIPLMGATLVAISRTMDYRHHPIDVFVGSVVGLAISHYAYRQYFPPLTHPLCHRPYSPRIPRESDEDSEPERPNAKPVPPSLAVGDFTNNGSSGPDDTVQRNYPEVSDVWRQGSRRGAVGAHDDRETVVRER